MSLDDPLVTPPATESTLHEIDVLVEEIAALSRGGATPDEFYGQFLRRVLAALAAPAGIVWARDGPDGLRAVCRLAGTEQEDGLARRSLGWHERCAAWALAGQSAVAVQPGSHVSAEVGEPSPSDRLLLFCPWKLDGVPAGVVEVARWPRAGPDLQRGCLELLEVACELLADYQRTCLLHELRRRAAQGSRLEEFARAVHARLDLRTTAYTIANDGRRLLACDRVSVLVRRGRHYRVEAISGTETFSRRAVAARLLERLTAAAAAVGDPLWYSGAGDERPPQIERCLDAYLEESHARAVGVLPLAIGSSAAEANGSGVFGAIVVESFSSTLDEATRDQTVALGPHIALALHNALTLENLPLRRLSQAMEAIVSLVGGKRWTATALTLAAIGAAVAGLALVPADFSVEAGGTLQPLNIHDIFAPDDGIVAELRTAGGLVAAGQTLLVLRKPELELEFKRVEGELETVRKRLAAVESEQLLSRREDDAQRRRYTELTAQQEELRALAASYRSQHAILQRKQAELEVRSPIAGELLTWNVEQLLTARPVLRGQVLLTVADLSGPWILELRVPDRRISHVLEAIRGTVRPLDVSFALATCPERLLEGQLDHVGLRTEVTEADGAVLLATARVRREQMPELVPGAGAAARIHCGRRAVGYVWLHDLIDAVRGWLAF
jgi:multidrug efflux pump subunit AcrA (membrane-fusion protein)